MGWVHGAPLLARDVDVGRLPRTCAGSELNGIDIVPEIVSPPLSRQQEGSIKLLSGGRKASAIVALGPVLGSMDSSDVQTELQCTDRGFVLMATVTRSAKFHGSVRQNENWRPKITVSLGNQAFDTSFEVIWALRLATGASVAEAETPPYEAKIRFPVSDRIEIHATR